MKLHFKIAYHTQWGQSICVAANFPELGNMDLWNAKRMTYSSDEFWELNVELPVEKAVLLTYKYVLRDDNRNKVVAEWGEERSVLLEPGMRHISLIDAWKDVAALENTFLTTPFSEVLLKDNYPQVASRSHKNATHRFTVKAPMLKKDEGICIVGDSPALGNWNTEKALLMGCDGDAIFRVEVTLPIASRQLNYKYGVVDINNGQFKYFEPGADRVAPLAESAGSKVIVTDAFVHGASDTWHGAGVGIPVFSLRSHASFGVGDFSDLKLMVDWAKQVGMKLIQVLPLNDTLGTHTEADVLPYAAISAFALNPLFLDLKAVGSLPETHELELIYVDTQKYLNDLPLMDFMSVIRYKLAYIEALYDQDKRKFLKLKSFKEFFDLNAHWLKPYSIFCHLRDQQGTSDYRTWEGNEQYDESRYVDYFNEKHPLFDQIALHWYIQYQLHVQLSDAVAYAHTHGVVLKGDIPIGVNRNSVDTWVAPELFHMHMQAGAPPDMFAVKGQNWELPTYNWEVIEATGFDWWKKRFEQMSCYFDTFRVDHILGFFRIWQIPMEHEEGIMGHLNPSIPLYRTEFEERGVWFDHNRFCKPYITDLILQDRFAEEAAWVKEHCLYVDNGAYRLRDEFSTQKMVKAQCELGLITETVKLGLYDIISNVLLFEVPFTDGGQFYPRYGLESLSSYAHLSDHQKHVFSELYVDYFFRRQDARWYESGLRKLPALKSATNMLICGEDLGMMTHCVTAVMKELSLLSLEIQRAPKTHEIEFFHPSNAPYLSVVTPSTHDMSTIRGWWEEDRGVTQRFYNNELGHWGDAPYYCEPWICRDILLQHLYSPAMWAIFQWQDIIAISSALRADNPNEERINVPSNTHNSWRYRMHIALEDLIQENAFNHELRDYIVRSGRCQ